MKTRSLFAALTASAAAFVFAGLVVACSTPAEGRVDAAKLDPTTFAPVSDMLLYRCGSLDCHGSKYRNFRLVGFGASRLDPSATSDGASTQANETAYNYQGLVALEPEKMAEVAANKGATMGELTFVRKGRGQEDHKGDTRIVVGDDADKCLVSWFAGAVDQSACSRSIPANVPRSTPTIPVDAGTD